MNTYNYAGILFLKSFGQGECLFTLAGGAGYSYVEADTENLR